MKNFDQLLKDQGYRYRFHEFQNLMRFRIREVLLVSSLYDSFILEEDGQLYDKVLSEYRDMNIRQVPGLTRVSTGREALEMAADKDRFDLIVITLNLGDMDALQFARKIKQAGLEIPVVLMAYETRELNELLSKRDFSDLEKVFMWQGDFRVLIAILKYIEDKRNVDYDTLSVGVQSIIVIEDNVRFYSSYLPMIYTELFKHAQSLISEGVNVPHKLLRRRARPKILQCETYEEAWHYYKSYEDCILGVISDIEFPREGKRDPEAGIRFAREVKASHFDIPILLQSDHEGFADVAEEIGASFLLKSSPTLLNDLRRFMVNNFSFGDFAFFLPHGVEVGRASNLREFEVKLGEVPDESIRFHAERNHFSNWLKARTEFWLAHQLRPQKVTDFGSIAEIRGYLIKAIRDLQARRSRGSVTDFDPDSFDTESDFARIGGGSLGGKARGLAFTKRLLDNLKIKDHFKGVRLTVPPALVLGTEVFDQFLDDNRLWDFAMECEDDAEILRMFLEARFPRNMRKDLKSYLDLVRYPLAVRSSSLLEDSRYLPFAGVYRTCMFPNSHLKLSIRLEALIRNVKKVYASTFSQAAKAFIKATPYRLEEEKMAVIVQKLVGSQHSRRFYPDFAGVARSYNYYPRPPMTSDDGIAMVGLGLGRLVIEGGEVIRFCPVYPKHDLQFADLKDVLKNSQKGFYALDMDEPDVELAPGDIDAGLIKSALDLAEKDGTLANIGSTYSNENQSITDGLSRPGARLVTFAPILKSGLFPLPDILKLVMDIGKWGMSSPVEIEFAVNLSSSTEELKEFGIVQVRPLVKSQEAVELEVDGIDEESLVCHSPQVLGNGLISNIRDIVMVDPERFERSRSLEAAAEVGVYNAELASAERQYLLIGMGRWGSADSWLGIPVTWEQISGARVIIETGFKDFRVVPSQGTHFFQNLTSFQVGYFTVNPIVKEGFVDWDWLTRLEPESTKKYTRHIHFDEPLEVRMNGHSNKGVIFKPRAEDVL